MKNKFSLFLVISLLFLTSCKTLQIEKPKESYLPSSISPSISELPLQIELDVKKLETSINKKMTGIIFESSAISGKDLSIRVSKAQDFSFTIKNNEIEYRVPLKVWSRFAWKVEKFGITVGDYYDATGSIALTYKTTINIDKNWKLLSKTSSSGFLWIETPKLSVIGVNVPVTPIANLALSQCEKIISTQIDKSLSEAIDLKKYVSLAWTETQKLRQINEENNIWVRISPKDLLITPFKTIGNSLNMGVNISAQIESFMGTKPPTNPVVSLPPFKMANKTAQFFNLNIGADVTFDKISEMAKQQLKNKTFSEGKKTITITDLSIFGNEGKAVFVADVIGSIKGRIYFTGKMVYNPAKTAVEIIEPEFDLKTQNTLAKSASWLLKGVILKQLTPYLTYPIKNDLEKIKSEVNVMLSNYSIMDGVKLQGKLNDVSVTSLNLVPGAMRIEANVKGNIGLKIEELSF